MIIFIIYIIGIFITPIILKKFFKKDLEGEEEILVPVFSIIWPLSILILLSVKFAELIYTIYDNF